MIEEGCLFDDTVEILPRDPFTQKTRFSFLAFQFLNNEDGKVIIECDYLLCLVERNCEPVTPCK